MNQENKSLLAKYGDWAWRAVIFAGIGANLWLTQNFVTRSRYDSDMVQNSRDHLAIQASISDIAATIRIMASAQARLEDHETRIRLLEGRVVDLLSRALNLERTIDRQKP